MDSREEQLRRVERDAIAAYAEAQRRAAPGEAVDVDGLCRARPELADELRRVHDACRWVSELLPGPPGAPAVGEDRLRELIGAAPTHDRYAILEELARGGMGTIYKVWDGKLKRNLAMKVSEAALPRTTRRGSSSRSIYRFLEEAQVMSQLDHPGVIPVHDIGFDRDGHLFFTMGLVRGIDLRSAFQLVASGSDGWTTTRAVQVLLRVCETVSYAHAKGVIHRDLKPANVMVGRLGQVYVMDWGLARVVGPGGSRTGRLPNTSTEELETDRQRDAADSSHDDLLTADGEVVGTPAYMPPEQAEGRRDEVGTRADVYAVGAMLYHLLAERAPYAQSSRLALAAVRNGPPAPLGPSVREAQPELVSVCEKAMARRIEDRYESMDALADDLRAFLEHRVVRAHQHGAWPEFRKWVERNRGLATTLGAALLLAITGLVAVSVVQARGRTRLLRLSDTRTLSTLVDRSDTLWPAHPELRDDLRRWLVDARELTARLPEHEAMLARIRARGERDVDTGEWTFADADDGWWHETLASLVDDLRAFAHEESGRIADVERRLAFADGIGARSVSGPEAAQLWAEALASIADRVACPDYDGLVLRPQMGLLPIGRDPRSGLWEFAHLQTGEVAVRDARGELVLGPRSGLVLVLLPGGTFTMGAQPADPAEPAHDPQAQELEGPPRQVTLAPFLLSKYEMTQGQWQRVTDRNPSYYQPGDEDGGNTFGLLNPVEQITWPEAATVLRRLHLVIPTEAQWEYAARAGTTTPWWTGSTPASIEGAMNLADGWAQAHGGKSSWAYEAWLDDGYTYHAPVGSFRPNAFGLHDTAGNLWEWVRDAKVSYEVACRAGDGERLVPGTDADTPRMHRGGSFSRPSVVARSAAREDCSPALRYFNLGVRPARPLER